MTKYQNYIELKNKYDILKKELDALKADIIEDLKKGDCVVIKNKLVFSSFDGFADAVLTIANTETIDTAAVKKMYPGEFLKPGTRETLTVKAS